MSCLKLQIHCGGFKFGPLQCIKSSLRHCAQDLVFSFCLRVTLLVEMLLNKYLGACYIQCADCYSFSTV